MSNYLYEEFELYFPNIAEKTVAFEEDYESFEVTVKLRNGDHLIFDSLEKSIRRVPNFSMVMNEDVYKKEFGRRLIRIVRRKGLTQKELSDLTGISERTLTRYTCGKSIPNLLHIDKIARALGCSVDEFRFFELE